MTFNTKIETNAKEIITIVYDIFFKPISRDNYSEIIEKFIKSIFLFIIVSFLTMFSIFVYSFTSHPKDDIFVIVFIAAIVLLRKIRKISFTVAKPDCNPALLCRDNIKNIIFGNSKFDDTERIVVKFIKNIKTHEEFVNELSADKNQIELNAIKENVERSKNGRFQCVFSDIEYFNEDKKQYMIKYFLSFYKVINDNNVRRIFPLPTIMNKSGKKIRREATSIFTEKEKCRTFLSYVIINSIAEFDTFVLMYNINKDTLSFFENVDYVIAESIDDERDASKLYFSYKTKEITEKEPMALFSDDSYLIDIMQKDFTARMNYKEDGYLLCKAITKRDNNYKRVLNVLNINSSEELNVLITLKEDIEKEDTEKEDTISEKAKKHAIFVLDSWINDINKKK
jgi:hypothetical protein